MVSGCGYLDTQGNSVKRYHKFSPNIPPKCRREIFFGVLAHRMTTFLTRNYYINTSVLKAGIPSFPGCLEHSKMIWISILSAKRDKTELHLIWLGFANAYGSVPHHLIRMVLDFFNFPSKVGEIIMINFNSAFMKFTVKDYTTKWQALEIGIMIGSVIFPVFSFGPWNSYYEVQQIRRKEWWKINSSSFQRFYGRHHHSRPVQNRS